MKNGAAVVTDDKGNFKINGKTGDEITISSVDYEVSTTKLTEGTTAEISLVSKNNKLTEVVVTALGIRRSKNTLPYAAQQLPGG